MSDDPTADVLDAILNEITLVLGASNAMTGDPRQHAEAVLRLAEAYAWLRYPAQPHGGTAASR